MSLKRFIKKLIVGDAYRLEPEEVDFISSASKAVMYQDPRGGRALLWLIFIFVLVAILWACIANVEEFTRGEGKVIPSQQVQLIQNLEGGILSELYVQEGEVVSRGQTLLRIDDTRFSSSLREADVTLKQLQLRSARLRAEAEGKNFRSLDSDQWPAELYQRELELYNSRNLELSSRAEVLNNQVKQKQQELSELHARISQLRGSVALMTKELEFTREAAKDGAVSEVELLRIERQVNDLEGELSSAQLSVPRVEAAMQESQEKLSNLTLVFQKEAREALNEATLELSQLAETSQALADRVQRTVVKSPVSGTVKRLLVNTIGGVIQPGMDIVEVVPSEEILLVEARIRPADIAYLHPDQDAVIRFTAYDFSINGGLKGKLVHISPDTIEDEKGDSFYLVRIETTESFTTPDGRELAIIPGMTVSVDIRTGEKTVMAYLLKPILKTKQLALRER